jgi:uncharacterized protein (TIGR02145 family)
MENFIQFLIWAAIGAIGTRLLLNYSKKARIFFGIEDAEGTQDAYVDLGLPSGTLWAKFNYGAMPNNLTGKYYTFEEALKQNELLKGGYQVPEKEHFEELLNECTWKDVYDAKGDFYGYWIIGPNGNGIFLPITGYYNGTSLGHIDSGYYWSTRYYDSSDAYGLYFNSSGKSVYSGYRYYARPIRLIKTKSI